MTIAPKSRFYTIAAAVFLLIMISVVEPAKSTQQGKTHADAPVEAWKAEQSSRPAPDTRGTVGNPLVVNATVPGKSAEEARQDAIDRTLRQSSDNRAFLLGAVTALILAVQFVAFATQAKLLRESIDATDANARRQLCAYVFIEQAKIDGMFPNRSLVAHVALKNFGQTPAYRLTLVSACAVGADWDKIAASPTTERSLGNLGPGGEHTFSVGTAQPMSDVDIGGILSMKKRLFVFGRVSYVDTFGRPHWLDYRLMTTATPDTGRIALGSCPDGNGTDEPASVRFSI